MVIFLNICFYESVRHKINSAVKIMSKVSDQTVHRRENTDSLEYIRSLNSLILRERQIKTILFYTHQAGKKKLIKFVNIVLTRVEVNWLLLVQPLQMSVKSTAHNDFDLAIPTSMNFIPQIIHGQNDMYHVIHCMQWQMNAPHWVKRGFVHHIREYCSTVRENKKQLFRCVRNRDPQTPPQTSGVSIFNITRSPDTFYVRRLFRSPDPASSHSWSLRA